LVLAGTKETKISKITQIQIKRVTKRSKIKIQGIKIEKITRGREGDITGEEPSKIKINIWALLNKISSGKDKGINLKLT
jgi:hypothetical protein